MNEDKNVEGRRATKRRVSSTARGTIFEPRPIDVIKANRPIIILDETQKMAAVANANRAEEELQPCFP